ncbi:MAG TPA: hypothetical protein VGQ37_10085 [Vicinamibacterales bacterium]|jgi:hypothetical protein|nr:hypothetical protein [Vicinamibacterales bacterium]
MRDGERDAVSLLGGLCLPHVGRALALMDRDSLSRTYGSMDRTYWYYRTIANFPGAVWQQPMVAFAALSRTPHVTNPFANDPAMLGAACAALLAWTQAQHGNGAFDEWYRNEFSYCPTAITTAGAVVTLDLLTDAVEPAVRAQALEAARRAGRWLSVRYNPGVMNQNLASAVALAGLAHLDEDPRWRVRATELLQRIAADQSQEGWFPEYDGFDFGYSTLALDFLALIGRFGFSELADPMADRLARSLLDVLTAGCAVPGHLGSRGTGHAFPFGALELSRRLPHAGALANLLLQLHASGLAAGPASVDDRYFAYFYFPAFCLAYHAAARIPVPALAAADTREEVACAQSGLAVWRRGGASVVINRRLGGATALLRVDVPPLYHLGYTVTIGKRRYSSAAWSSVNARHTVDADAARSTAQFAAVSSAIPLRWFTLPFQLVVHTLVSGRLAEAFQALVKRVMISRGRPIPLVLERRVTVAGPQLLLEDTLRPARSLPVDATAVTRQPSMYSPSARQDHSASVELGAEAQTAVGEALRAGHAIVLRWTIQLDTGQAEVRVTR